MLFKQELFGGKFDGLGAEWREHNVSELGAPPDFVGAPAFRVNDGPLVTVNPYRGQTVYNELYDRVFVSAAKPPERSKLDPRPVRSQGEVPRPSSAGQFTSGGSATREQSEPAVDIDWSGVRFGVLVTDGAPVTVGMLRGPTQSLLDIASGGQCRLEVIHESSDPRRFQAVCDALEIEPYTVFKDIYPFMTIDKVANVNLVRSIVLKKIETALDEKIHGEEVALVPDMIFRRVSEQRWQRVVMALDVQDDSPAPRMKPVEKDEEPEVEEPEKETSHKVVAALLGGLITMKIVRTVRGVWGHQKEVLLDQMEGVSGEVAAVAAPVAASSPAVASPVPAPAVVTQPVVVHASPQVVPAAPAVAQPAVSVAQAPVA
jgi:hypothetical protein